MNEYDVHANPTTFFSNYQGETKWSTSKTIYDPCPVGWRVPNGGERGLWRNLDYTEYDAMNRGISFVDEYFSYWYPSSGQRYIDGRLCDVGNDGYYWACTYSNIYYGYTDFLYFNIDGVYPSKNECIRDRGLSVRCIRE